MLQLGQTSCLGGGGGLVCLLLLMMSGTGTLGQYDPPCHTNCSWTNAVGEIQQCMQEPSQLDDKSVCPNLFGNDGSAPPVENIEIDSYATTHSNPIYSPITRLNISFDLNLNGSGIYRGVIIEIQHFEPQELYCHYIDFEDDELTDDDLLTEDDKVRRIFFDCSRAVRPGGEYLITIKTMPSTEKPVFKYYWPPSCFYRKDDIYCQTSEEDLPSVWSPSTYYLDGEGDRRLELTFNLAPYDFDRYLVYLKEKELINDKYQNVLTKPQYCLHIYVKNKNVSSAVPCPSQDEFQFEVKRIWEENNETMVTIIWTDVKEAIYYVEMEPRPTAEGQQCSTNNAVDCYIKRDDVIVKARPCERIPDPCEGEHMRCEARESNPTCSCEKGFKMQNETCIEEPPCERIPNPCEGDNMLCTPDGLNPICSCETGFRMQDGTCKEDETPPEFGTSVAPPDKNTAIVAAVLGSTFGVLAIILVIYLVCRNQNEPPKNLYSDKPVDPEPDMTIKRVFVIHSFDHELHKEVVLKLCIFLTNVCKLDIHTALWSTKDIAVGVNEWMHRECEEADKVIILCSQGTLIKWRAQSRQIDIKIREDNLGDLFSAFMRLQGQEIAKDPKKFIVAYMDYSYEEDIPQPLKFLQKYQLMDHVEQMFYILNDMEKHGPIHDFNIPALQTWDTSMDAGVELKMAVDQMKKKIRSEPNWFFDFNEISTDAKLKIFTKQSQRDTRPNPEISIICDADPSVIILPQTDIGVSEDDYEYQMSALNSLRQTTSKPNDSFQSYRNHDSGVHDVYGDLTGDDPATHGQATNDSTSIRNSLHGVFQDPNEDSCV